MLVVLVHLCLLQNVYLYDAQPTGDPRAESPGSLSIGVRATLYGTCRRIGTHADEVRTQFILSRPVVVLFRVAVFLPCQVAVMVALAPRRKHLLILSPYKDVDRITGST